MIALTPRDTRAQDSTQVISVDTLAITVTRGADLARVPAAVSLINRTRIQAGRLGVTLDEVLADVPGLIVNNRYNFALGTRISIRGLGARAAFGVRGIRLIQDGIPLTMPDGQSAINNIDLTSAGRIEVLRGSASMLHGNAAGGVIDIRSEQPEAGFFVEGRSAAAGMGRDGLDDMIRFNLKLGGGSQRTRYLVSGARIDADGSRDHARFEQNNLTARLEHGAAAARTAFTLSIADAPVAQNPGSLPRDSALLKPRMAWPRNVATAAGEKSRQIQGGIEHIRAVGAAHLNAVVYGLGRTLQNPLPFAYITLDRKGGGVRSVVAWRWLSAGVDIEAQQDERAEYENSAGSKGAQRRDQTDRIVTFGPFLRTIVPLSSRTTLSAGVRYDHAHFEVDDRYLVDGRDDSGERTLEAVSPSIGIAYTASRHLTVFASVGSSFQTPTTTELINAPPVTGQTCCAAGFNRELDPERALTYEIGARANWHDRLSFDASVYHIRIRDALVPFQVPQADGRDFFRNAGRTRNNGFEIAANAKLTQMLRLTMSYTYNDFVFADDGIDTLSFEGNRVPGVSPHHLLVRPSLRVHPMIGEGEVEYTASYFADDANTATARNNGVVVINLRLRSAHPMGATGIMPFAALNNLTDRRYNSSVVINAAGARYFEPAPGRNIYVGLAVRFARTAPLD